MTRGRPRTPKPTRPRITIDLSQEELEAVMAISAAKGMTPSQWGRSLLATYATSPEVHSTIYMAGYRAAMARVRGFTEEAGK